MTVTLKLITNNLKNNMINIFENKDTFTLNDIYKFIIEKGLTDSEAPHNIDSVENQNITLDDITKIKMIYKGQNLSDEIIEKNYILNEPFLIYLFTTTESIKSFLIKFIFTDSIETDTPIVMNLPLSNTIENDIDYTENDIDIIETITPAIIEQINCNIVEQFKDDDFVNLLRIIITKPHLLEVVNNYINSGNIINEIPIIDPLEFKYNEIYDTIMSLNIVKDTMHSTCDTLVHSTYDIKSIIQYFNGNMNYIIRYIMYKNVLSNTP